MMIDMISNIMALSNGLREQWLTKDAVYKTKEGREYPIHVTPWVDKAQGQQALDFDNTPLSQKVAAFTVSFHEMLFNGEFYAPQEGDTITESIGGITTVNVVTPFLDGTACWRWQPDNPNKDTIQINTYRRSTPQAIVTPDDTAIVYFGIVSQADPTPNDIIIAPSVQCSEEKQVTQAHMLNGWGYSIFAFPANWGRLKAIKDENGFEMLNGITCKQAEFEIKGVMETYYIYVQSNEAYYSDLPYTYIWA